jgi:hypothetical protein
MSATQRTWVILVVGDPSKGSPKASVSAIEEPDAMLRRALSLTALARVCCVLADSFLQEWGSVCNAIATPNRYSLRGAEPVLEGLKRCLTSIGSQNPTANVTVIPYNHCAVEELTWLDSAKGALRLGNRNRNTVYLLHDKPDNDPRVALQKPEICTSSVMIGASEALLALCVGERATTVVELVAGQPGNSPGPSAEAAPDAGSPLNVVHIRLLEEYARLQRIDVRDRPAPRADVQV